MPSLHLPQPPLPTPESIQAAKEAMWRDRYQVQLITGVIVTEDGRIVLPKASSAHRKGQS